MDHYETYEDRSPLMAIIHIIYFVFWGFVLNFIMACGDSPPSFVDRNTLEPLVNQESFSELDANVEDASSSINEDDDVIMIEQDTGNDDTVVSDQEEHSNDRVIDSNDADSILANDDDTWNDFTPTEDEDGGEDQEQALCKEYQNVDVFHVAGQHGTVELNDNEYAFLRVTGNQNTVNYNISSSSNLNVGVCLFVSGNRSAININISNVFIADLVVIIRGNQNRVEVNLSNNGDIGSLVEDINGNSPLITIID